MAGAESPSMADLSSNNGEDSPQRAKKGGGTKRKSRHSRNLLTPTGMKMMIIVAEHCNLMSRNLHRLQFRGGNNIPIGLSYSHTR